MQTLKIATGDPGGLIGSIKEKIDENLIRSWTYQEDIFYHKGQQYRDHIYFTYRIDAGRGTIEFLLTSDGNKFAESRAFQLLERMLLSHFGNIVEIIS